MTVLQMNDVFPLSPDPPRAMLSNSWADQNPIKFDDGLYESVEREETTTRILHPSSEGKKGLSLTTGFPPKVDITDTCIDILNKYRERLFIPLLRRENDSSFDEYDGSADHRHQYPLSTPSHPFDLILWIVFSLRSSNQSYQSGYDDDDDDDDDPLVSNIKREVKSNVVCQSGETTNFELSIRKISTVPIEDFKGTANAQSIMILQEEACLGFEELSLLQELKDSSDTSGVSAGGRGFIPPFVCWFVIENADGSNKPIASQVTLVEGMVCDFAGKPADTGMRVETSTTQLTDTAAVSLTDANSLASGLHAENSDCQQTPASQDALVTQTSEKSPFELKETEKNEPGSELGAAKFNVFSTPAPEPSVPQPHPMNPMINVSTSKKDAAFQELGQSGTPSPSGITEKGHKCHTCEELFLFICDLEQTFKSEIRKLHDDITSVRKEFQNERDARSRLEVELANAVRQLAQIRLSATSSPTSNTNNPFEESVSCTAPPSPLAEKSDPPNIPLRPLKNPPIHSRTTPAEITQPLFTHGQPEHQPTQPAKISVSAAYSLPLSSSAPSLSTSAICGQHVSRHAPSGARTTPLGEHLHLQTPADPSLSSVVSARPSDCFSSITQQRPHNESHSSSNQLPYEPRFDNRVHAHSAPHNVLTNSSNSGEFMYSDVEATRIHRRTHETSHHSMAHGSVRGPSSKMSLSQMLHALESKHSASSNTSRII